jgi:hypothetical protein
MKRTLAILSMVAAASPAFADDHVIIEHATVIGAGVTTLAAQPALFAGEITQKVVIVPATTGAKGQQAPITVPAMCGAQNVIPVRSSNTGSASAVPSSASITLGQNDETGEAALIDAMANAQLAAGPTINIVAALRDCSKAWKPAS